MGGGVSPLTLSEQPMTMGNLNNTRKLNERVRKKFDKDIISNFNHFNHTFVLQ